MLDGLIGEPDDDKPFSWPEIAPWAKATNRKLEQFKRLSKLAIRLGWHILRDNPENKRYAVRFVGKLEFWLSKPFGALTRPSIMLAQIFANNPEMLEWLVENKDDKGRPYARRLINRFVSMLRDVDREWRFLDFLKKLTQVDGKGVRPLQWFICQALLAETEQEERVWVDPYDPNKPSPQKGKGGVPPWAKHQLLLQLKVSIHGERKVFVEGDQLFFPGFVRIEIVELLRKARKAEESMKDPGAPNEEGAVFLRWALYLQHSLELMSLLVLQRNMANKEKVKKYLPFDVVCELGMDDKLCKEFPEFATMAYRIMDALYVNHAPHEPMGLKTVRVWDHIENNADSGALASRDFISDQIEWKQFDELKRHMEEYFSQHPSQKATEVDKNRLLLQMVITSHNLVACGFYTSGEIVSAIPQWLAVLDGKNDVTGLDGDDKEAKYKDMDGNFCSTRLIMESKTWICKILKLVCDQRTDIRLSQLLYEYKRDFTSGRWGDPDTGKAQKWQVKNRPPNEGGTTIARWARKGYAQLHDETPPRPERDRNERKVQIKDDGAFMQYMSLNVDYDKDGSQDFVPSLMDLTYYDNHELVSSALSLLVHEFDHKHLLREAAMKTQVMVNPKVVNLYKDFDAYHRQLQAMSRRRRLIPDERYRAVRLLGLLTMRIYEEDTVMNRAGAVIRLDDARSMASTGTKFTDVDGLGNIFLLLVGKVTATVGQKEVVVDDLGLELGQPQVLQAYTRIQLQGQMYMVASVKHSDEDGKAPMTQTLTLDKPFSVPSGGSTIMKDVWLFVENRYRCINRDVQMLMYNMGLHTTVLQLLRLPFKQGEILPQEITFRSVLQGVYRFIKALTFNMQRMQLDLIPWLPTFIDHTDALLEARDVTPTAVVETVFRDNRSACQQVEAP